MATKPVIIIPVRVNHRLGLVVDCIPFSPRGFEPCYCVRIGRRMVWVTEREMAFVERRAG